MQQTSYNNKNLKIKIHYNVYEKCFKDAPNVGYAIGNFSTEEEALKEFKKIKKGFIIKITRETIKSK